MKHWIGVVGLVCAVVLMTALRRAYRDGVIGWSARRAGDTERHGRTRALTVHGAAFLTAAAVTAFGLWAWQRGGDLGYARYPAALVVLVGYVPIAAVGAPKLTKWQRNHEQRLVDAGAVRSAAHGWDAVARVFSVLGVVLGFFAVFLLVVPN